VPPGHRPAAARAASPRLRNLHAEPPPPAP
jgi:hypothetical protein